MSESKIILPFPLKAVKNENQLQVSMFMELESKGFLRVKQIGATCSINRDQQLLARVIYMDQKDAVAIAEAMNIYFKLNKMLNWGATVETCELF